MPGIAPMSSIGLVPSAASTSSRISKPLSQLMSCKRSVFSSVSATRGVTAVVIGAGGTKEPAAESGWARNSGGVANDGAMGAYKKAVSCQ